MHDNKLVLIVHLTARHFSPFLFNSAHCLLSLFYYSRLRVEIGLKNFIIVSTLQSDIATHKIMLISVSFFVVQRQGTASRMIVKRKHVLVRYFIRYLLFFFGSGNCTSTSIFFTRNSILFNWLKYQQFKSLPFWININVAVRFSVAIFSSWKF